MGTKATAASSPAVAQEIIAGLRTAAHITEQFRTLREHFSNPQAYYEAARTDRTKRARVGLGGTADRHLPDGDAWYLREMGREFQRNSLFVAALIKRIRDYVIYTGFELHPETGDEEYDEAVREEFAEWASDADLCDFSGRLAFWDLMAKAFEEQLIDGDFFIIEQPNATLQALEADRCWTPTGTSRDVRQGVLIDEVTGRPLEYWFIKRTDQWSVRLVSDTVQYPRDQVIHVVDPNRVTQTRGVTALHAVLKYLGMADDLVWTELVRIEMSACLGLIIENTENTSGPQFGPRQSETVDPYGNTAKVEGLAPGLIVRGKKGQTFKGFNPNIPGLSTQKFTNTMNALICNGLGLSPEIGLLDFTNSNYSSHRGSSDIVRRGFRVLQARFARTVLQKVYWWILPTLMKRLTKRGIQTPKNANLRKHKWLPPGFPDVDPLKDRMAQVVAINGGLENARDIVSGRGGNYDKVISQSVKDMGKRHRLAIAEAQAILKDTGIWVDHRELISLDLPKGIKLTSSVDEPASDQAESPEDVEELADNGDLVTGGEEE